MKFLVGVGVGSKPSFNSSAGTLTFDERVRKVKAENVLLIVNCSTNQVLHNSNNTDLQGDWDDFGNSGVFNLINHTQGTMTNTDELHAWVDIHNGVAGIDFLSDLAIKSQTYAALNDIDLSLEGDLTVDLSTTNAAIDDTNIALNGTASSASDGSVTGELKGANAHLATLAEIPMTFFLTSTNPVIEAGVDVGGFNLTNYSRILSIRSLHNSTEVIIERDSVEIVGDSSGSAYSLAKDDVLDMVCDKITISALTGTDEKAIVYAII
tara:strand:- start:2864 stop:3661 length:798 start_codon:yes stop_codon:yes gene_type:complete